MSNVFESAIVRYTSDRTEANLDLLSQALVEGPFLVPVDADPTELSPDVWDIPAICFRRSDGQGVLPAFTTVEQLLHWKPEGCRYVELQGQKLVRLAEGMAEVDAVSINCEGAPRGAIPRSEFQRLLARRLNVTAASESETKVR